MTDIAAFLSTLSAEELSSLAKAAHSTKKARVQADKDEKARVKAERDALYAVALTDVLVLLAEEDVRNAESGWTGVMRNGIAVELDGRAFRVNVALTDVATTDARKAEIKASQPAE